MAVGIATGVHLLNTGDRDWNAGAAAAHVAALLLLFFAKETIEDERVRDLKLKALAVAFFAGWAVNGAIRFAVYLRDRFAIPRTMSAYDARLVMLIIAHALFHFCRFQDGPPDGMNAGDESRRRAVLRPTAR